jgi:acyl-CoA thioester hydrolase
VRRLYLRLAHRGRWEGWTLTDYLHEAHYPQPLEARVGVVRVGNSSFELALALFQNEACVCLAEVVMVHVTDSGATPLPTMLVEALEARRLAGSQ